MTVRRGVLSLLPVVVVVGALTLGPALPAGAALSAPRAPRPSDLVLGTNGLPGFKAEKPMVARGPQYDDGCKAIGGRVGTVEKGGFEVTGGIIKLTGGDGSGTVDAIVDVVDAHTSAAEAIASLDRIRNEASKCGVSLSDKRPSGKVSISRPPAVKGLSSFARFRITGAVLGTKKVTLELDSYRRGEYVLAVTTLIATVHNGSETFDNVSPTFQAAADRASGAKLVRETPGS